MEDHLSNDLIRTIYKKLHQSYMRQLNLEYLSKLSFSEINEYGITIEYGHGQACNYNHRQIHRLYKILGYKNLGKWSKVYNFKTGYNNTTWLSHNY